MKGLLVQKSFLVGLMSANTWRNGQRCTTRAKAKGSKPLPYFLVYLTPKGRRVFLLKTASKQPLIESKQDSAKLEPILVLPTVRSYS
jgi:hypothetical protein